MCGTIAFKANCLEGNPPRRSAKYTRQAMTRAALLIFETQVMTRRFRRSNSWERERIENPYEVQVPEIGMTGIDGLRRPLWREYGAKPRVL